MEAVATQEAAEDHDAARASWRQRRRGRTGGSCCADWICDGETQSRAEQQRNSGLRVSLRVGRRREAMVGHAAHRRFCCFPPPTLPLCRAVQRVTGVFSLASPSAV